MPAGEVWLAGGDWQLMSEPSSSLEVGILGDTHIQMETESAVFLIVHCSFCFPSSKKSGRQFCGQRRRRRMNGGFTMVLLRVVRVGERASAYIICGKKNAACQLPTNHW